MKRSVPGLAFWCLHEARLLVPPYPCDEKHVLFLDWPVLRLLPALGACYTCAGWTEEHTCIKFLPTRKSFNGCDQVTPYPVFDEQMKHFYSFNTDCGLFSLTALPWAISSCSASRRCGHWTRAEGSPEERRFFSGSVPGYHSRGLHALAPLAAAARWEWLIANYPLRSPKPFQPPFFPGYFPIS